MATNEITNTTENAKVTGTSGKDSIVTEGNYVTVTAGAGDDTISNTYGHTSRILAEDGNDSIYNGENSDTSTLDGGKGDDTITNHVSSNVIINGGDGNDYINNTVRDDWDQVRYVTVNGGAGNDTIYTNGKNGILSGDAGDDFIQMNHNGSIRALGGAGNDQIFSYSDQNTVDGGADDDTINNTGIGAILLGGAGNDQITNSGWNAIIGSTSGDNEIQNTGRSVSISTGTGNDTIFNRSGAYNSTIAGGDGTDFIENAANSVTTNGGAGDDSIENNGSNGSINGGDGNDRIDVGPYYTSVSNTTVKAGAGNDSIIIGGAATNNLIQYSAGDGKDVIEGFNDSSTIQIGDGEDDTYATVASGDDIIITVGDGNMTLVGAAGLSTLNILGTLGSVSGDTTPPDTTSGGDDTTTGGGDDTTTGGGDDTTTGGGDDTTTGGGDDTTTGGGDDTTTGGGTDTTTGGGTDTTPADTTPADTTPTALFTTNKTAKASLTGTTYGDEIYNYAKNVTIRGGEGGDLLTTMRKTSNVRIYGDAGDDTIEAYNSTKVTLSGGAGNDYIYASGSSVTINAGAGNDSIELDNSAAQILYKAGEGNDLITGFSDTATLKIGNGTTDTYKAEINGEDVVVTVGNEQLTISGAASWLKFDETEEHPNILGTFVNIPILDNTAASPYTVGDEIETVDASARTKAIKITGNALDNSIVGGAGKDTLYGGKGADIINGGAGNDKIYGDEGDDTLTGGAGNDTLTGGDGEDMFVYTGGKDVIADYVAGEDAISLGAAFADVTAKISGNNNVLTVGSGTLTIKGALGKELMLIDSTGMELSTVVGVKYFTGDDAVNQTLDNAYFAGIATARTSAIKITGNDLNNSIVGGSGKDTLYGGDGTDILEGGKGNDKLYGQAGDDTLWGGTGNDTLTGGEGEDMFVYTGGKDVIADYVAGEDAISLGAAFADVTAKISGNNNVLTVGSGTLTIKGALGKELMLIDSTGTELSTVVGVRYFTNDDTANQTLDSAYFAGIATSRTTAIKITGNDLNNSIVGGSGKDTLYGGDGNDILEGGAGNDKLYGQAGDDTLWGGTGNDTLTGGEGEDMFVYTGGKDVIADYVAGEDAISLGAAFADVTAKISGNNNVLTVGSGTLTIKGALGKELMLIDSTGTELSTVVGVRYFTNDDTANQTLDSAYFAGIATARTTAIKITGNELNNSIVGGSGKDTLYGGDGTDILEGGKGNDKLYGEDGDDTLYGGLGYDSLWGGEGADTFIYNAGDGKDFIFGFEENDIIQITGVDLSEITASKSSSALVMNIDNSNSITFKTYATDTFNINGDYYEVKGNQFVKIDK